MGISVEKYIDLKTEVLKTHANEFDWSEQVGPVGDPHVFWSEFSWVVINSGMKNQVAQGIWNRVRPVVEGGGSASEAFGHKGKSAAIDYVWRHRVKLFELYQRATDTVGYLKTLPWIGPITCWHLAKNFGLDCVKPDRHLVRIAGAEGPDAMCRRIAASTGDRVATVDLVIWRGANLGYL